MNTQSSLHGLDKRVQKLERRLKLAISVWVLSIGLVLVCAATSQTKPETAANLRARQLTIIDEKGTERIYIGSPVPAHGREAPETKSAFNGCHT